MKHQQHAPVLTAFLGNFGSGSTAREHERELRRIAKSVTVDVTKRCSDKHWWQQVCNKALARGMKKSVLVITTGQAMALKFTQFGDAPRSLTVRVEDMGPDGDGDAQVCEDDIVLLYNGHDHYNGLVSPSVAVSL